MSCCLRLFGPAMMIYSIWMIVQYSTSKPSHHLPAPAPSPNELDVHLPSAPSFLDATPAILLRNPAFAPPPSESEAHLLSAQSLLIATRAMLLNNPDNSTTVGFLDSICDWFRQAWDTIVGLFSSIYDWVRHRLHQAWHTTVRFLTPIYDWVRQRLLPVWYLYYILAVGILVTFRSRCCVSCCWGIIFMVLLFALQIVATVYMFRSWKATPEEDVKNLKVCTWLALAAIIMQVPCTMGATSRTRGSRQGYTSVDCNYDDLPRNPMTPEAASRIQSATARANFGVVPEHSFASRAQSAAARNTRLFGWGSESA